MILYICILNLLIFAFLHRLSLEGGQAAPQGGEPMPPGHGRRAGSPLPGAGAPPPLGGPAWGVGGTGGAPPPVEERDCAGERETKNFHAQQWWRANQRRRPRWSQGQICRLSTNYRPDRRIEGTETKLSTGRTQRHPRILSTTHRSKVIAHRSCCRSWNHSELR
jgi:hypothetical protein